MIQKSLPFLDVNKVFDSVWNEGFIYKVTTLYTPIEIVKIIESLSVKKCFENKIEGMFWTTRQIFTRI